MEAMQVLVVVLFEMDKNIRDIDRLAIEVIEDEELMEAISKKLRKEKIEHATRVGFYNHGKSEGKAEGKVEGKAEEKRK